MPRTKPRRLSKEFGVCPECFEAATGLQPMTWHLYTGMCARCRRAWPLAARVADPLKGFVISMDRTRGRVAKALALRLLKAYQAQIARYIAQLEAAS
jgi:hypothetical protein